MVYLRFLHDLRAEAERWLPGWPAADHEESDLELAAQKVLSGHYSRGQRPPPPGEPPPPAPEPEPEAPLTPEQVLQLDAEPDEPPPAPEPALRAGMPGFAPGLIPDATAQDAPQHADSAEPPATTPGAAAAPSRPSDEPTAVLPSEERRDERTDVLPEQDVASEGAEHGD